MKQLYGLSFTTIYGDVPSPIWVERIAELSDREVRAGLKRLSDNPSEYPANLTQFVDACRPQKRVRYLGRPTTPAALALPRPRANEEHRANCLAAMRKAMAYAGSELIPHSERSTWNKRACTCKAKGECDTCRWFAGVQEGA